MDVEEPLGTTTRAPLSMRSQPAIILAIRRATSSGRASWVRSASGIAAACIAVSISPGSTEKKRTCGSSAAQERFR